MEFESKIAALEGADAARGFSSGMAAISSTVLALCRRGSAHRRHPQLLRDAYRLFERLLPHLGIKVDYVDGSDPDAVKAALPGAAMLYLESRPR
jgi:cystathionine beta-lyase/cystathionine gamma-synthase